MDLSRAHYARLSVSRVRRTDHAATVSRTSWRIDAADTTSPKKRSLLLHFHDTSPAPLPHNNCASPSHADLHGRTRFEVPAPNERRVVRTR